MAARTSPGPHDSAEILRAAREMARRHPEVDLIYLFGSRAHGHAGPLSDYDLGIHLDRTVEIMQPNEVGRNTADVDVERLHSDLLAVARKAMPGKEVDLIFLNGVPVELAYNVISAGRILFERSTAARVEYEAYVLSRYGDYLPVLRRQKEDILDDSGGQKRIQRYREALGRTERALGSPKSNR